MPVKENKDKSKSAKKEKKNGAETPAAKTPKGKENVEQVAKSATKKKNKGPPIEVKHLEFSTIGNCFGFFTGTHSLDVSFARDKHSRKELI